MATVNTPSLKSLLVSSKSVEVEFPGFPDFKVEVNFLTRDTLVNIRKKATKPVYKNRQPSEELDDKLFLKLYVEAAIKGWKGLKVSYLEQLAPIDTSGQDPDALVPFSHEDALALMQASSNFDAFISETVTELSNFTKPSTKS